MTYAATDSLAPTVLDCDSTYRYNKDRPMPRSRTIAALTAATLVIAAGAYVTADIYDLVPGVLTIDRPIDPDTLPPPVPEPEVTGIVAVPAPTRSDPLGTPDPTAPVPDRAALAAVVEERLAAPGFFGSAVVQIADGPSGEVLYALDPDRPVTPASAQKLLSGAAILHTLDPGSRLTTAAVRTGPDTIALVAGGDTMLAPGAGDPDAVEGHAGLADLAEQVVERLGRGGSTPEALIVSVEMTYAAGPRYAPRWNMEDVRVGYNQGVTMIGLAGQRPRPFEPSPPEPELEAVKAFTAALVEAGIPASVAAEPVLTSAVSGPRLGAVRSATVAEITALAMADSDNALTEGLSRQASASVGGPTDFEGVAQFVVDRVAGLGVDVDGAVLFDTSGMTYDQLLPARVVSDLLTRATTGTDPVLTPLVADLPIAGLSGTLDERFLVSSTRAVAGIPRAKTGTINATAALAGTTVTRDGRLLTFVVIADRVPREGRLEARLALDRLVAALTECGCQ
ncbi:MAG: D-alanyl-D-alanine carboxypeptidase/D-alanyl-D-alanine-endopeptidase [Dermatophilaceae bacterium]